MKKLLLILLTFNLTNAFATEQLKYSVMSKDGKMEVRQYEPYLAASVSFDNREDFERYAFRVLADYIFGNNIKQEEIAMTAPVITSEEIAMTAPVITGQNDGEWIMSFSMPSKYTMETLPMPVNEMVKIDRVEGAKFATITYSGYDTDNKRARNYQALYSWITEDTQLQIDGPPVFAGYNPPWTPPFMRKNEVMIPVR